VVFGLIISGCFFHVVPPTGKDESIDIVNDVSSYKTNLIAGQHTVAGSVTVSNDGENLFVTYETVDNWLINETHLYVGTAIPTNSAPGKFPYKHEELGGVTTDTYEILLDDLGVGPCDTIYIAAHADLIKGETEETGWAKGVKIEPGKNWAMYFNYQIWPCGAEIPELTEAISQEINLSIGGTIEVDDPENIIYGVKLTIPPIPSKKDRKKLIANITISYIENPYSLELPDNRGFLLPPVVVNSDVTLDYECILEIPYTEATLNNMGLSSNEDIKIYHYNYYTLSWEEVTANKRNFKDKTDFDYIAEKKQSKTFYPPFGLDWMPVQNIDSIYVLTYVEVPPPFDPGFPQPGDLLYRKSNFLIIKDKWVPGHVGIYVGEKAYDGVIPYNVIEALHKKPDDTIIDEVVRNYYNPISEFAGKFKVTYMGAVQPSQADFNVLDSNQREKVVWYAEEMVGESYAWYETINCLFGMAKGDYVKGTNKDGEPGYYNCVGLTEAAYEFAGVNGGVGLVTEEDEGNNCILLFPNLMPHPRCVLTPAEQYAKTEPAEGYSVSGQVADSQDNEIPGVTLNFELETYYNDYPDSFSVNTNVNGDWDCGRQLGREWNVTPQKDGYTFEPSTIKVTGDASDIDFVGTSDEDTVSNVVAVYWTDHYPSNSQNIEHLINVFWDPYPEASGYEVYRSVNGVAEAEPIYSGSGELLYDKNVVQWHDLSNIEVGNSYSYYVTAYGDGWETAPSQETGTINTFLPPIYLVSPSDGETINNSTPTFEWSPVGANPGGSINSGITELWVKDLTDDKVTWDISFNDMTTYNATYNQDGKASPLILGHSCAWEVTSYGSVDSIEVAISQSEYWEFTYGTVTGSVHNLTKDTYYDTIQAALDDADSLGGDTIEVSDGTYDESITFPSGKNIILQSINGASLTTIRGNDVSSTVILDGSLEGSTLEGFTITHASGNRGGGIWTDSYLAIKNCIISGNAGYAVGGIGNGENGSITIIGSTISDNTGDMVGGIGNFYCGSITITESTISGNTCTDAGSGGINNQNSSLIIIKSTISGNVGQQGGGIFNHEGSITIIGSTISGNVGQYAGGIFDSFGPCSITITGSTISGNSTYYGNSGIYFNYLTSGTLPIGGNSDADKNTICGNYQTYFDPSLAHQIRDYSGSLYEAYKDTNIISAYCN